MVCCCPVLAQMQFSFDGVSGVTSRALASGATLVEFPLGTDLASVMASATVTVDGLAADASDIVPNPTALSLNDGQVVTFLYKGKAYAFRFSEGRYFTAVFLSDPHIGQTGGTSVADMQAYVSDIVGMGRNGTSAFCFDAFPDYVPTCDIAFSTGDMDEDSKKNNEDFKTAHSGFAAAGIPFVTMCGNHDLVPDYWTGESGSAGLTLTGGSPANDASLATVKGYRDTLTSYGISDVETFNDGTGHVQSDPFTFTFNGVRFYVGQVYWFQKTYTEPTSLLSANGKYFAPDGVISKLEAFVDSHAGEPSVWMQHYPFATGSDVNRWWLDQNDVGRYIKTEDSSEYGTNDDVPLYTDAAAIAVAKKKKDKLAEIIGKTRNPVHFSGHAHWFDRQTYNGVTDYVTASSGTGTNCVPGAAHIVLMKEGVGVVEVRQAVWTYPYGLVETEPACLPADGNAATARMAESLGALGVDVTEASEALAAATTQEAADDAAASMVVAFGQYIAANGGQNVDVTAMLGANADFEATQGEQRDGYSNLYAVEGWNEHVESWTNDVNRQYIKLQKSTEKGAATASSLFLRAKWQDVPGRVQIRKQVAVPAGHYVLGYWTKKVGSFAKDLCYMEVGDRTVQLAATTVWKRNSVSIDVDRPTVVTLSFGFVGGQGATESALYVDDVSLTFSGFELSPGADMTGYVRNATLTGDTRSLDVQGSGGRVQVPDGWDFAYSYGGWNDTFVADGVFNAWAGSIGRAELSQKLSLPNGAYRLTAELKTDQPASASTIALYGAAANGNIGRSEEAGNDNGADFQEYSCAFDVTDGAVTIGVRSDNAYYQMRNLRLTYLGETADEETDNAYLRQDYYWNGRNAQEFDATAEKYANARDVVVYPHVANQLVTAASASQFADMVNKIVGGVCQSLLIRDGEPFHSSLPFTAVEAVFGRQFVAGVKSTLCLPFAPALDGGKLYDLTGENGTSLIFTGVTQAVPNKPYIFIADADGQLSGQNVEVAATPSEMRGSTTASGFCLVGVYATTAVGNIYGFSADGEFLKASEASVPPFRSFIQSADDVSTSKTWTAMFGNASSDVEEISVQANGKVDVRTIGGAVLRTGVGRSQALEGLPHGLYIITDGNSNRKVLSR